MLHLFSADILCFIDQMIRNGNVELQAREEEIRFLKMQMSEENRSIGLLRGQLPNRRNLEEEQTTLRIQVHVHCCSCSLEWVICFWKSF